MHRSIRIRLAASLVVAAAVATTLPVSLATAAESPAPAPVPGAAAPASVGPASTTPVSAGTTPAPSTTSPAPATTPGAAAGPGTASTSTPTSAPTSAPAASPSASKPTSKPSSQPTPKPTSSATPTTSTQPSTRGLPRGSGTGRRIVYSRAKQHVWVVGATGAVIRDFAVTGRRDWPRGGTYHVFSKSPSSYSTHYHVYYRWMIRFTVGHTTAIGFHSIPTTASGRPIQRESQLGQALGLGGCVRSAKVNASWLYGWAGIGTTVVVL